MFELWWQDVRHGVRSLMRSPGFMAVALLTLAIGVGANTTVFAVVEGVLLRPLPYARPDELVWVDEVGPRGPMPVAWANVRDWHAVAEGFDGLTAYVSGTPTVVAAGEPVQVPGAIVSEDFWRVFRVNPVAGRLTLPDDHREGAAPVIVVTEGLAQQILGSVDPIGKTIEVGGSPFEVIGVVSSGFSFPQGAQHWSALERNALALSRTAHNYSVVGRLAEGADLGRVHEGLNALQKRLVADAPPRRVGVRGTIHAHRYPARVAGR